jgi:hypothetical protein
MAKIAALRNIVEWHMIGRETESGSSCNEPLITFAGYGHFTKIK